MKSNKEFRGAYAGSGPDDVMKKAVKLPPLKKSGKEKHQMYSALDEDDDLDIYEHRERESVLDYFDEEEDF